MDTQSLSFEAFEAQSAAYDRDVAGTAGIDGCCSASDWIIPAHHAFAPGREAWIFRGDHGWLALARNRQRDGMRVLLPLEPVWGFASACIGGAPRALAADVVDLLGSRAKEWDALLLTGLAPGSPLWRELTGRLSRRHRLFGGASAARRQASLAGGLDGFLSRRSRDTRRSLARATRAARGRGIVVETAAGAADLLYARVLSVEARSWKGSAQTGLAEAPMREFYERMIPRLAARGGLRLLFATCEGLDVGYILGGVFGDTYRGLQFSYDAGLDALGLGNVLQLAQLEALCAEGVRLYDLGCDAAYKARWAEAALETSTVLVVR
jgi:hypothetical protein